MDHQHIIDQLEGNGPVYKALLTGISVEQAVWQPSAGKWSLLEACCHLADEEREDFGLRVRMTLEEPTAEWPGIDPPQWVVDRKYNERELPAALDDLLAARERSVAWLNALEAPNWQNTYQHPSIGPMSAEFILANWLAHDMLHMRQIIGLKWAWHQQHCGDTSLAYAGDW